MSHSLKALDVSKIALPRPLRPHASLHYGSIGKHSAPKEPPASDITTTFSKALGERLCGHGLEELVMGQCALNSDQLKSILEGVVKGETKRLSLEGNALTDDGLAMVGRWMKGSGVCEALDLSNNNVQVCSHQLRLAFAVLTKYRIISISYPHPSTNYRRSVL
jgi:hypothetical protein